MKHMKVSTIYLMLRYLLYSAVTDYVVCVVRLDDKDRIMSIDAMLHVLSINDC